MLKNKDNLIMIEVKREATRAVIFSMLLLGAGFGCTSSIDNQIEFGIRPIPIKQSYAEASLQRLKVDDIAYELTTGDTILRASYCSLKHETPYGLTWEVLFETESDNEVSNYLGAQELVGIDNMYLKEVPRSTPFVLQDRKSNFYIGKLDQECSECPWRLSIHYRFPGECNTMK